MRDKLIELLCAFDGIYPSKCSFATRGCEPCEKLADFLIANGVTFAEDNNVPCKCGGEERFVGINKTLTMTAGDCIRAMSDEELAETFIAAARGLLNGIGMNGSIIEDYKEAVLAVIKQPAGVEG